MPPLTEGQKAKLLTDSYRYFARHILKIKTDDGIIPFEFNMVQDYIDFRANDQMKRTGRIRMIVVKARQQGCSEYVCGRGFKKAIQEAATSVYILSHEDKSVAKLFDKVDRYCRFAKDYAQALVPEETTANKYQKKFKNESNYTVGTAGSDNTGRSDTNKFGHLSEPAHYSNDTGIKSGLLQTISNKPGTEIWWESTANGLNWFHEFCEKAVKGLNGYEVIFCPWFWSDKYNEPVPQGFKRTLEENALSAIATIFNKYTQEIEMRPLTDEQLQWRRLKIEELGEKLFKQEYPATYAEAFQSTGESFIDNMKVEAARKCEVEETYGANILGVDPAHKNDRMVLLLRKGRQVIDFWSRDTKKEPITSQQQKEWVAKIIEEYDVDRAEIDTAHGYELVQKLRDSGFADIVNEVDFGEGAEDVQFLNKRAELFHRARDWFNEKDVNIPDRDDFASDIACIPEPTPTDTGRLKFKSKADIKADRGNVSPDIWDAFVLTFAERVKPKEARIESNRYTQNTKGVNAELTIAARRRQGDTQELETLQEQPKLRRLEGRNWR
jgi:hypothetical protein